MVEYPSDWKVASFSDVFLHQKTHAYQLQNKEVATHGDLPVVDQGQDYIVGYTNDLSLKFTVPSSGVIVFGDHTRIVKYVDFDFCVGADGTQVLACKDDAYTRFVYYLMQDQEIPNLGYSRHFKYVKAGKYVLPPLPEQKRIAKVLDDVDRLFENLGKRIAKKRLIKKGIAQELLTGKKRLPGFVGAWKTVKLGEYVDCLRGVSYDGDKDVCPVESSDTIRLLRSNNIQEACFVDADVQYVKRSCAKQSQVLRLMDIMVCMANGSKDLVGKSCLFRDAFKADYTFGAFMGCLRATGTQTDMEFIFQLMNSDAYAEQISLTLAGSSINNLRPSNLLEMKFQIPKDIAEQRAIAKVLSDMDEEIASLEARQAKLKLVKKGMLQDLLTGKVRLK